MLDVPGEEDDSRWWHWHHWQSTTFISVDVIVVISNAPYRPNWSCVARSTVTRWHSLYWSTAISENHILTYCELQLARKTGWPLGKVQRGRVFLRKLIFILHAINVCSAFLFGYASAIDQTWQVPVKGNVLCIYVAAVSYAYREITDCQADWADCPRSAKNVSIFT